MIEQIQPKLSRIEHAGKNKPRKKIAVLGAGMAGLVSAYELGKLGHEVVIFEANDRLGGRAWTHRFDDEQYHELGAMRFPKEHDHTRYYANLCCLKFRTFINHHDEPDAFYFFKGIRLKHSEWETKLLPELNLTEFEKWIISEGPIPKEAKHVQLLNLLVYPLELLKHELESNPFDKNALLGMGPMTPRVEEIDKVSLGDFLRKYNTSKDAIELIGSVTGLEVWWDKAVTMFVRDEIAAGERLADQGIKKGIDEIVGGTDLLPQELAKKLEDLKVDIRANHKVSSITKKQSSIHFVTENSDGGKEEFADFDHVICTLPFSILRTISLHGLSEAKMSSIRNLTYASSTKVLLNTEERFWEGPKYNIKGGGSQSDLINRQIYYPSDNVSSQTDHKEGGPGNIHAQFQEFKTRNVQHPASEPGVLVGSYVWGRDARRLGAMRPDDRTKVVIDAISHIHPEILQEGMVKDSASISWDSYKHNLGAFCFMKPGDFTHYYKATLRPEGNLFFAGEHCSLDNGWIQGAIISGLKAVEDLLAS